PATPPPSVTYTLSLHDALPIFFDQRRKRLANAPAGERDDQKKDDHDRRQHQQQRAGEIGEVLAEENRPTPNRAGEQIGDRLVFQDRKSTRLNSSHLVISYAVFC